MGQYIGPAEPGAPYFDPTLFTGLSKKPGVLGSDFGYWTDASEINPEYLSTLITEGKKGTLITLAMYIPDPFNRRYGDKGFKKRYNFADTYTPGTVANERINIALNNMGNVLQQLKDEDIIVLLRPYLEMNGGWFWWGHKKKFPTQDEYRNLWIYTYNYFENERQFDNLLWVYGPNYTGNTEMKATDYYYPGTDYVDIVGLSYYKDDLNDINKNDGMTKLEALNKPIAMTEIGSHNGVKTNDKMDVDNLRYLELKKYKISYFLVWSSWRGHYMAIRDSKNADQLLDHGLIITQDELHY